MPFSNKHKAEWFKHMLIDNLFAVLIEQRIALPMIFHGWWSRSQKNITNENDKIKDSVRVLELVIEVLLKSSANSSVFLKLSLDYISCLNQTSRFSYPYLDIQDSIPLSNSLAEQVSHQLRLKE